MEGCGWRATIKCVNQNDRPTYLTFYTDGVSGKEIPLREPLPAHNHPYHRFSNILDFPLTQHLQTLIVSNVDVASGLLADRTKTIGDFLWSDRNMDLFFRTLPLYTVEELACRFRYSSVINVARRLYSYHHDARAKQDSQPQPGDFGVQGAQITEAYRSTPVPPEDHSFPTMSSGCKPGDESDNEHQTC